MKYKRFEIKLGERIGRPECTYLKRWYLETPWWSVRLHHWLAGDDPRYFHDHPWNFWTIVLWGTVYEKQLITNTATEGFSGTSFHHRKFSDGFKYFAAEYKHIVSIDRSTWTLMFTGPKKRRWGFIVDGKWIKANKFFFTKGLHECGE